MVISSPLELPELLPTNDSVADLTIRFAQIDWTPEDSQTLAESAVQVEVGAIYFFWPAAGKFLAREGNEIVIDPLPGIEQSILRLFLLGAVLAAILHQRGLLVLHASALAVEDNALVFMGEKGQGKSTLAASLHRQIGNETKILADDIVAVDLKGSGEGFVLPGFPQMKLSQEVISLLRIEEDNTVPLHPIVQKTAYRPRRFSTKSITLRNIYVLNYGDRTSLEPLTRQEAFLELVRHSFLGRHVAATGQAAKHFAQCTEIANSVPVERLTRPRSLALLPSLASFISENFKVSSAVFGILMAACDF